MSSRDWTGRSRPSRVRPFAFYFFPAASSATPALAFGKCFKRVCTTAPSDFVSTVRTEQLIAPAFTLYHGLYAIPV